ncbi:MAG: hypothetical protein ACRD2F_05145, partial [Terriglobales bacterium]
PHGGLNRLLKESDSLGARAAGPPAASHRTCASHQYGGPYAAFFGRGRAGSPRSQTVAGRVAVPPAFFSSL